MTDIETGHGTSDNTHTCNLSDLTYGNICEKLEPLGETSRKYYQTKHQPCFSNVRELANYINEQVYNMHEDKLAFITVRPSPEFIYMKKQKIPSYKEQLTFIGNIIQPLDVIAGSIETGTDKKQILHVHLICHVTKRKEFDKQIKRITNEVTCLHKIYGKQHAVFEQTNKTNIHRGISYYLGIDKNNHSRLKPDVFKTIIMKKNLKELFSQ